MPKLTSAQREAPCSCGSGLKVKDCCKGTAKKKQQQQEVLLGKAFDLIDAMQLDEARVVVEALIADGGRSATITIALVLIDLLQARFADAERTLRALFTTIAPGDVHAGGMLAQVLLMLGRKDDATALVETLMATAPKNPNDVIALVGVLNLLGRDQDIIDAVAHIEGQPTSTFTYAAGVAHFNLGHTAIARQLLRDAIRDDDGGGSGDVQAMANVVNGAPLRAPWPRLEALTLADVAPGGSATQLLQLASEGRFVDDEHVSDVVARIVRAGLVYAPDFTFVDALLTALAHLHPTVALRELRGIWQSEMLSDQSRQHAVVIAVAASLIAGDASVTLCIDGKSVTTTFDTLQREGAPAAARTAALRAHLELPQAAAALVEQALLAVQDDSPELAVRVVKQLAALKSDHPAVRMHLLVLQREGGDIDDDAVVTGLRALIAIEPRLLAARLLLAKLQHYSDVHDDAVLNLTHLDDALDDRDRGMVHAAVARSAQRRRDHDAAREHAVLALTYLGIAGLDNSAADIMRLAAFELDEHRAHIDIPDIAARLARVVAADAPTSRFYEHLGVEELEDMLLLLRIASDAGKNKAKKATTSTTSTATTTLLVAQIADGLQDPTVVQRAFTRLPGAPQVLVTALLDHHGRLPWEQALRLNLENDSAWDDEFGLTPLGQLLSAGLAVVANIDGAAVCVMPPVVLAAAQAARAARA